MASSGLSPFASKKGDDGVGWVSGEAVLALVPLLDELLRAEVAYHMLGAVGEEEGGRSQP